MQERKQGVYVFVLPAQPRRFVLFFQHGGHPVVDGCHERIGRDGDDRTRLAFLPSDDCHTSHNPAKAKRLSASV